MALETFNYLNSLVADNPVVSDGLVNGDDHIRGIKLTLLNTFPGVSGALTSTLGNFSALSGTAASPGYGFAAEPSLGFYRAGPGVIAVTGGKLKGGAPTGALFSFPVEPPSLGKVTADTGKDYLECNGATYNTADYPDLAQFLGASGSTFTVPNATDTGRFMRSRSASIAVGSRQASQNKTHTHPVIGNTGNISNDHTHAFNGTTGVDSPDHTHGVSAPTSNSSTGGGSFSISGPLAGTSTGGASTRHTHSFSGNTGGVSSNHTHPINFTSGNGSADGDEARPESLAVVLCIKT